MNGMNKKKCIKKSENFIIFVFCYSIRYRGAYDMKKKVFKIIIKSLVILVILGAIAIGMFFILKALGFTTKDDFVRLRGELGDSFLFWLIIGLLQIVQVIFIPISNQVITVPLALIFPTNQLWKVWLCSWTSIWIATMILYFVGRFAGKRILNWVLSDKEQSERCANFLRKGWVFYPIGMLLPLPDDLITILAGTSKMNFWLVLVSSFFTRAIDTCCSVYGWGFLTKFWYGWIILAVGIIGLGLMTFIFWKWQKKVENKQENK